MITHALSNIIADQELEIYGLRVLPSVQDSVALPIYGQKDGGRRSAEALRAYLYWAAFRANFDPNREKIKLSTLRPFFPDEKKAMPTLVWYFRALNSESAKRERTIALYNALGTLDCGFAGIKGVFETTRESELGEAFLRVVDEYRREEDDFGAPPRPAALDEKQIDRIRKIYTDRAAMWFAG